MRERTRKRLAGCVLGALGVLGAISAADAAEIEVLVRERGGREVPEITVVALAVTPAAPAGTRRGRMPRRAGHRAVSDRSGRLRLADLPPGTYELRVPRAFTRGLVPPSENPAQPPPLVTLRPDQRRAVTIELWRGVSVRVRADFSGWDEARFTARFEHLASGDVRTSAFDERRLETERLLAPGVWHVTLRAPPGFLLDGLYRDGVALAGDDVTLDLRSEPLATELLFLYRVEAGVEGELSTTAPTPGLRLEAELLDGGPWLAAALERGGSTYDPVAARPDPTSGRARLPLPSGRWRLRPIATVPITSEPEAEIVELAPGDLRFVHFDIVPEAAPDALTVHVADAASRDVEGAAVELYREGELVDEATTGVVGNAHFFGLVPGAVYRVVAGAARTLEAAAEIRFDPGASRSTPPDGAGVWSGGRLPLRLPEGAGFEVEAFGIDGDDLPGVLLDIERVPRDEATERQDATATDDLPPIELQSASYRRSKLARRVLTDKRGHARATGFYEGLYRLRARLARGEIALGRVLLSAGGEDPAAELLVELAADELAPIEAALVLAARLATTLQCDDGGALPEHVDVRVFRALRTEGGVVLAARSERPALELRRRPVDAAGRLVVGPLDAGAFELALRPEGFARWTWAFETTERERAQPIPVAAGDVRAGRALELGVFVLGCEPAVDLVLAVEGGLAPLSEELRISARLFDREHTGEAGAPLELRSPSFGFAGDVLELRRIRPGKTRLVIELTHPRILPEGVVRRELELELERGGYLRQVVTIPVREP